MKKNALITLLLFNILIGFSQTIEIKYYHNSYRSIPGDTIINSSKFKKRPDYNWFTYTLKYSKGISLYKNDDFTKYIGSSFTEIDTISSELINNYRTDYDKDEIKIKEYLLYKNYNEKKFTLRQNMSINQAKTFEDNFVTTAYKITNETKQILNFTCKKAIVTIGKSKFYYWYTDELGVVINPIGTESVPGVVLEIESLNFHILAYDIKVTEKSTHIIKPEFPNPYFNLKQQ